MKAIIKTQPGKGMVFQDAPMPEVKEGDLLLKIHRTSICGSDIPIYNYSGVMAQRLTLPFIPGHELCGEVVEMGSQARGFKKGDFVSVESHVFCGMCFQCRNDQRHVCFNNKTLGIDMQGGFAEYAAVPAKCAWKHSDDKFKDIGSIMEPLGNAVFATLVEDVGGKTVAVFGAGPQGLFAIEIAKACGAQKVIAIEASAYRKKMAEQMGADVIIDPMETDALKKIISAAGDPSGVDVVLEMSGNKNAVVMGLQSVKNGGRFTAFGLPGEPFTLDYSNLIVFKGIRVQGITGREIFRSWYKMEALLRSGAINPAPVITHVFEMKDMDKGFAVMMDPKKECGKVVLVP